jgi:chemotaxis signal transduction protein
VVDLAAAFGLEPLRRGQSRARTLIARVEENVVAVPVDLAREVHSFAAGELRACRVTSLPYATAEAELMDRAFAVIDLARFVDEIQMGAARELGVREGAQQRDGLA